MSTHRYNYMITTNPPGSRSEDSDKPLGHHIRLMPGETISNAELVKRMHKIERVLSPGTCVTAIDALSRAIGEFLADGRPVTIAGLGTLRPRLSGEVAKTARGLAARDVHVSGIQFTPDAELLAAANQGSAKVQKKGVRALPSKRDVEAFLDEHFAQDSRLTRKAVMERFKLTKYQTLNLLQALVDNGTLAARGSRATAHYVQAS